MHEDVLLRRIKGDVVVEQAYMLTRQFVQMVQQRQPVALDAWIRTCQASDVNELRQFATRLERDDNAIRAALTYEWSNGQVEGHITRIKLIKRQMYDSVGE